MLENRLFYLAALTGMVVFHCYYTGWISWFLLIAAACLPLFSLAFSLRAMLTARVQAEMPAYCWRGEEAILVLKNASAQRLPSPLCRMRYVCVDKIAGEAQMAELKLAAWARYPVALPTAHCGAYVCRLEKGRIYDYLGLFSFPLRLPEETTLFVLPEEQAPQPLPNLSQFRCKSYRPKHGGGFSEIHDMRPYRAGDSLRDIHWKLSAKTDRLIVREAQEPNRGQTLLTLDLCAERAQLDQTLDILCWLSRWLLRYEVRHSVGWLQPQTLEPETAVISSEDELSALIERLLQTTVSGALPSIASRSYPNADWRYHIGLAREGSAV